MVEKLKDNIEFRNRLMELRKQKGWSQEELGYRVGVSRQTVSKWETGEATPEITKLVRLGKLYNLTVDELVEGKEIVETKVVTKPESKVKRFVKKHLRKIILIVVALLLVTYLGFSAYKFCLLKDINDKFNDYKNVDNCYFEMKKVVTNNEIGAAYIINERYWYKDEYLKIEEIKTENGVTTTIKKYLNLSDETMYTIFENTKEVVKRKNINEYSENILEYKIKENYYVDYIDVLKNSLDIFKNIRIDENRYIKQTNKLDEKVEKIYNKENGFIKQSNFIYTNEEIRILYDIKIEIVKDEDVKIEFLDLTNYEIIEQ